MNAPAQPAGAVVLSLTTSTFPPTSPTEARLGAPPAVPPHRTPGASRWLAPAAICSAAELGVLLGIGRRAGTPWLPVNALAHALLGARADGVWNFAWDITAAGACVLLVACSAAAVAVASLKSRSTWGRLLLASVAVSLGGYLLHVHVIAPGGGGLAGVLGVGELRAVYFVAAIALAGGMRLAFLTPGAALDP